ncbi:hypothetical protein IC229_30180 [Spirosoma sp. BT702]|uniref:ATP-binding protein n=1 Tax=Spirosoma profusum TaxID=2771354 RepID=A0A927AV16_9BACT|nr:hypothetical protein [Spirosoma profusum]MBD2704938.1 hypothetical protein [Spirosoma profusum]
MVDEAPSFFRIQRRFLRSTQLERDWRDPEALQDYVLTNQARQSIGQIAAGLSQNSGLRAWRITGDYGSGKSSFGLLLAHLLHSGVDKLPNSFKKSFGKESALLTFKKAPNLFPILITGSREALGLAIVRGLYASSTDLIVPISETIVQEWSQVLKEKVVTDEQVLEWLKITHKHVVSTGQSQGTFLLLDEVGKFLEFAAMYPDRQDIYLLQSLSEFAVRSGKHPFYITALLHQGISAYAETLPVVQQKEWEKVAGRYEEILWHQPAEQLAELIANALDVRLSEIDVKLREQARTDMDAMIHLHWYGAAAAETLLSMLADRLYPLHPTVIPPLIRLFSSFGQNERSLFAFLLGNEPFGLQDFVSRTGGNTFFRLYDLYDYVRNVFGARMQMQGHRNHWKAIETIVSNFGDSKNEYSQLVKTIGLLNVLNADNLIPTDELLQIAIPDKEDTVRKVSELSESHHLYKRGRAGGYSLWPHTSINLEDAYQQAKKAVEPVRHIAAAITDWLDYKPIIARRHYIQTGTLRYFELVYCDVSSIRDYANTNFEADGRIIIPLCETPQDCKKAIALAEDQFMQEIPKVLLAVPAPLEGLGPLVTERQRWNWIERNIAGLEHDIFAQEEVSRQIAAAELNLQNQIRLTIGITTTSEIDGTKWFWKGLLKPDTGSRSIMTLLTEVFDEVYSKAPRINNELINRRVVSSAASKARLRLIDLLFRSPDKPFIGLEPDKTPPEMSMYLSVIQQPGLHRLINEKWTVALPDETEDLNLLLPTFTHIRYILNDRADQRVSIQYLNSELQKEPYGVRDGLFYLLLAIYAVINEQELAFYEDGTFIPRVTGNVFQRITKAPETFDIQYYPLTQVRTSLFRELFTKLNLGKTGSQRIDLLDVVKPLASFAAALPKYTINTKRLSPQSIAVRDALIAARDPSSLLFSELPKACGLRKIDKRESRQEDVSLPLVNALQLSIDEIRGAYPKLLQHILLRLLTEFQLEGTVNALRVALADRGEALSLYVKEARLKSFCLRIADRSLPEEKWAESMGSLICSVPPASWRDPDVHRFEQEIHNLVAQFIRVEAVAFLSSKATQSGEAVRVALTQATGEERERVLHLTDEEQEQADTLKQQIMNLIGTNNQVGMVAASRALWDLFKAD